MKAVCKRSSLAEALGVITAGVPAQAPTPVARDVLISVDHEGLRLESTDLTIFSEVKVLEIKEAVSGEALTPIACIAGLVHELDKEFITIEREEGQFGLSISSGNDEFKIIGHDPGDFPSSPETTQCAGFEVESAVLTEAIRLVAFAASKDPSRRQLMGVAFVAEGAKAYFVASDGKRLAEYVVATAERADKRREGILPLAAVEAIAKLLPLDNGQVSIKIDPDLQQAVVSHERGRVLCRLIEGQMPDYVSLIPSEFATTVEGSARELLAAVRKAAVLTTRDNAFVRLEYGDGAFSVHVSSKETGSGVVPVDNVTVSGDPIVVNFAVQYLSDGLRVMGDTVVRLGLQKSDGAAVVHGGRAFRYAFMPVRPRGADDEV